MNKKKEEVFDVMCVITRYFGGIMLGAGGLVRAYSHTSKIAVDAAGNLTVTIPEGYSVEMIAKTLEEKGAMDYSIIVSACANEAAPLQYIAPFLFSSVAATPSG